GEESETKATLSVPPPRMEGIVSSRVHLWGNPRFESGTSLLNAFQKVAGHRPADELSGLMRLHGAQSKSIQEGLPGRVRRTLLQVQHPFQDEQIGLLGT